jgi:hypothetical protein
MNPIGYIGYSILSDISGKGRFEPPPYFKDVRQTAPDELFLGSEDLMRPKKPGTPFRIVYGDQTVMDREHALNLAGYDGVEMVVVPDCKHEVTTRLLELDRFNDLFIALLKDAGQ